MKRKKYLIVFPTLRKEHLWKIKSFFFIIYITVFLFFIKFYHFLRSFFLINNNSFLKKKSYLVVSSTFRNEHLWGIKSSFFIISQSILMVIIFMIYYHILRNLMQDHILRKLKQEVLSIRYLRNLDVSNKRYRFLFVHRLCLSYLVAQIAVSQADKQAYLAKIYL